jgi:hypothetical protein
LLENSYKTVGFFSIWEIFENQVPICVTKNGKLCRIFISEN